jgi:pimeloyl-ACP methyl ester carboxylesterase
VLTDFIAWALSENTRADSAYRGKIDTTKIALAGHSCGGLQAIALAHDPRVTTVVILNSGTIPSAGIPTPDGGTRAPAGYVPSNEADLTEFHTPVLYLIGGPTDQAYAGSQADFKAIERVPLFSGNYPVGHGATYREPRGGLFGAVATDWLDWQLKGNTEAAKTFSGPSCRLCSAPNWTVERKNMR